VIWRFFRRREKTTTEEENPVEKSAVDEVRTKHAPSMSAFSFRTTDVVQESASDVETDTAVDEGVTASPEPSVAAVVRQKTQAKKRQRAADRGVHPVLVPNLSELSSSWRISALRLERDQPQDAIDLWTAYLTLVPTDNDAWFRLGQAALSAQDIETASQAFLQLCDRDPENGLAHGALGYIASEHQVYDEAIERYQAAVRLRPRCRDMLTELLRCQRLSGDEESAARTSERLVKLDQEAES
jgi:tetratricopeptide (TPR) repeat protein